ncbi:potassium transporter Trk [Microbacterium sp. NIBRBAC000506063]|uniref:potassium transporter Trk n=1 Tax=Microbacterium sp. NIBRBAC000506063 TaxID=2734618 RepID=UPI001BB6FEB6|nr:potassium transporter Trk [Microbacterium sp. NIBRBAC000506063]QTV80263.1 potassium transporter Trk [Microbacterium sp. NIBRBAC000506063]
MEPDQSHETSLATVRRVPRYGVFMALGAVVAVIVTLVLTISGSGGLSAVLNDQLPVSDTGVHYSFGQVLGFALLFLVPVGVALGALVAVLIERLTRKNDRVVRVDHETIIEVDEHPEPGAPTGR